jgi:hypothetical protein
MAAAELTGVRPDELEWGGGGGGRSAGAEWMRWRRGRRTPELKKMNRRISVGRREGAAAEVEEAERRW